MCSGLMSLSWGWGWGSASDLLTQHTKSPGLIPITREKKEREKNLWKVWPGEDKSVIFWREMLTNVWALVHPQSAGCRFGGASLPRGELGIHGWETAGNWVELLALALRTVFSPPRAPLLAVVRDCWQSQHNIAWVLNKRGKCVYEKVQPLLHYYCFTADPPSENFISSSFLHHQNPSSRISHPLDALLQHIHFHSGQFDVDSDGVCVHCRQRDLIIVWQRGGEGACWWGDIRNKCFAHGGYTCWALTRGWEGIFLMKRNCKEPTGGLRRLMCKHQLYVVCLRFLIAEMIYVPGTHLV